MKLYQFAWGIYPRRVLIYLREKGIDDIDLVEFDVLTGENRNPDYLSRNPLGTLPMLETDSGCPLRQSTTILLHLESCYPAPGMMGSGEIGRARTLDQLFLLNEAYHYAGMCTYYGSPVMEGRRKPSDEVARAMRFEFGQALQNLEALADDGDYLGGASPNLADIVFFASQHFMQSMYRLTLPASLTRLPGIYERFSQRPSAEPAPYPELVASLAPLRASVLNDP